MHIEKIFFIPLPPLNLPTPVTCRITLLKNKYILLQIQVKSLLSIDAMLCCIDLFSYVKLP
ncbi:hypothetical protein HMPREF1548_03835 [Clostridium sp. KLE 1755]|nr:hypothetical protein HMPREF1548_03835 [Clostridium sp. KLE 1755]